MQVMMVSGSFPPMSDGVGLYSRVLVHELQRVLGETAVHVVTSYGTVSSSAREEWVTGVPNWGIAGVRAVLQQVLQRRPDIVHFQFPAVGYGRKLLPSVMPLLVRIFCPGVVIIATIHEYTNRRLAGKGRIVGCTFGCDGVIVVDASYGPALRKARRWSAFPIVHIPDGSTVLPVTEPSEAAWLETRQRLGISPEAQVVCWFGAFRPRKGLEVLLDAFARIVDKHPDARLLLIGRLDQPYYTDAVEPRIRELQISERVVVAPNLPDDEVSRCLGVCDVCALPFDEGLSTKRTSFMAALCHRLPIVTTKPTMPLEALVDGYNIAYSEPGDVDDLALRITQLLDDPSLRRFMVRNLDEALRVYSWETIARCTVDFYSSLLHARGGQQGPVPRSAEGRGQL